MDFSKVKPVSKEPFVFGPMQTKWLEALEGGVFRQGQRQLVSERNFPTNEEPPYKAFCCLGVLCEVAGLEFVPHTPEINAYGYVWGEIRTNGYLPPDFAETVGLLGEKGQFKQAMGDGNFDYYSLAELNDTGSMSFSDIAAYIRHDPHNVFTKSV